MTKTITNASDLLNDVDNDDQIIDDQDFTENTPSMEEGEEEEDEDGAINKDVNPVSPTAMTTAHQQQVKCKSCGKVARKGKEVMPGQDVTLKLQYSTVQFSMM
jgi:hypothetical protein